MNKTIYHIMSVVMTLAMSLGGFYGVAASSPASASQQDLGQVYYVSPTGSDTNSGSTTAPFRTIQKAAGKVTAGGKVILLAGSYSDQATVTASGAENNPITISGSGATFTGGGALIVKNSNWLVLENLAFKGATNQITLQGSHYISIRNSSFDYATRGIYIQDYSSHILVENNEFYQSCAIGKTWTQLKDSTCEGGAVYGSSYGGGTYHIRNNWVHDAFNGFFFSDDTAGQWMNSNVFIYNNRFERISDDPVEPEGDSFNFHVYGNTMIDTHRLTSLTTAGLGPVFIYNNVQITKGNPTNEASRLNSAFKIDLSGGYTNGVWIFNNTISGENATNFSAYDMLSKTISSPLTIRNNIYVTKLNAFNGTPSGGSIDYDMSKASFGMTQPNGIIGDALLLSDGKLNSTSKAIGKSSQVSISSWFGSSVVVKTGTNLGAFQSIPAPAWVMPPNYPSQIPANVSGWPNNSTAATSVPAQPTTVTTATVPVTPTLNITATSTVRPITATPTYVFVPSKTPTSILPTSVLPTTIPPTAASSATPSAQSSSEVIFNDKDSAFVYSYGWSTMSTSKAYKGSYKETTKNNATATLVFTGQSFSIVYKGGVTFGKLDVYVDEILVGTLNQKLAATSYQSRWDYPGQLTLGTHTLKLVFKVTSSTIYRGSLDAVIVRSTADTSALSSSNQTIIQTPTQTASPTLVLPTITLTSTQIASPTLVLPTETQTLIPPSMVPSETPLPESPTPTSTATP